MTDEMLEGYAKAYTYPTATSMLITVAGVKITFAGATATYTRTVTFNESGTVLNEGAWTVA